MYALQWLVQSLAVIFGAPLTKVGSTWDPNGSSLDVGSVWDPNG